MSDRKYFFLWVFRKIYILYNWGCGDSLNVARMRWKAWEMNKATIRSTGRSMGRFYTVVDGKQVWFDFKGGKTPGQK